MSFEYIIIFVPQKPIIYAYFHVFFSKLQRLIAKKRLYKRFKRAWDKIFFIFLYKIVRRCLFIPQVQKSEQKLWRTRLLKKVHKRGGSLIFLAPDPTTFGSGIIYTSLSDLGKTSASRYTLFYNVECLKNSQKEYVLNLFSSVRKS